MPTDFRTDLLRPGFASRPFEVSAFEHVSLEEVSVSAARPTRIDRKYLVPVDVAQAVLDSLCRTQRLLIIAGRTSTTYRSLYFDTPDFETARAHVQRRRRRWKARSRVYVEDQLCRLEVKTKDARGMTVKSVTDADLTHYGTLRPVDLDYIAAVLTERSVTAQVSALRPAAEVTYQRVTLADLEQSTRVTADWGVSSLVQGGRMWVDVGFVLMETKGGIRPGVADRVLAEHRIRPCAFSKYVAGVCLLGDDLPANDFLALVGRQVHSSRGTEPACDRPAEPYGCNGRRVS